MFSLITVLFFMPAMILKFSRWNDKTRHRPFLPSFRKFSEWVYRVRYASLIIMLILAPPAYVAQGMNDFLYGNSAVGASEGTQVYADDQVISREFGRSNMMLAMYPNTSAVTEKEMSDEIEDLPYVKSVTSMSNTLPEGIPEEFLPYSVTSELHTKDYCRMLITYGPRQRATRHLRARMKYGIFWSGIIRRIPIWWGKHLPHRISRLRLRRIIPGLTCYPCWACSWWSCSASGPLPYL